MNQEIAAQKFNSLTLVNNTENGYAVFSCECGKEKAILRKSVFSGKTKSCGCSKIIDFTGKKIGKILVINRLEIKSRRTHWNCLCDCGKSLICRSDRLSGKTSIKHCGCSPNVLIKDISIGQKFGNLTALKKLDKVGDFEMWLFKCDCGKEVVRRKTKGLNHLGNCGHTRLRDLSGQKFNFLTALNFTKEINKARYWLFRCDCGKEVERVAINVTKGATKSCGCKKANRLRGQKCPNWRGGKTVTRNGYVYIYSLDHPFRVIKKDKLSGLGYVMEHRLVMEQMIGRYLQPSENVHHKNGIRNDNRPENLELWIKHQPTGARAKDLVAFSREILKTYGDLFPE